MFQKTEMSPLEVLTAVGQLPIHDSLALRTWLHPDKKLFTFIDDDGIESDVYSYLDLWQRARAFADTLEAETEPGDRILLFFPQGLDFIAAFFGCLLSSRIAVPTTLPTRRRVDKSLTIVDDCGAKVAIAPQKTLEKTVSYFKGTEAEKLKWIDSDQITPKKIIVTNDDIYGQTEMDDVAFLQYTSGSTSNPKGVMVTHRNITSNLQMMRDSWELDTETDMVFWQPHHHDMGLIMGQLLPVLIGNHTVTMSPNTAVRQPAIWLKAVSKYKAKLTGGPNFIYELAAARYSEKRYKDVDLSSWEIAPNGADVVRSTTLQRFYDIYKNHGFKMETFMPCYGLAEGTLFVTGGPTKKPPKELTVDVNDLEKERKVVAAKNEEDSRVLVGCGEPSWETEVAIVDPDTGLECGVNEVGEIWVHGRAIAAGYWKNPEATEKGFHGTLNNNHHKQYLCTGDIGFIGAEDKQLYICGRLKDLIICDGRNLHPEDIEYTILESSDAIKPQTCAVFSYDKDERRQSLVAVIETDRELKRQLQEKAKELRTIISKTVTDAHGVGISEIHFIPPATLKKTTSGKVQRSLMKSHFLKGELDIIDI